MMKLSASARITSTLILGLMLVGGTASHGQSTGDGVGSLNVPGHKQNGGGDAPEIGSKARLFSALPEKLDNRDWGVVIANHRPVMGIPAGAGGYSALQRAQLIAVRMQKLYERNAHFKDEKGYEVALQNGETVLRLRNGSGRMEQVFTVDSSMFALLAKHNKSNQISRADVAFHWRDILLKALQGQDEISVSMDPDAWANIPTNAAHGRKVVILGSDGHSSSEK